MNGSSEIQPIQPGSLIELEYPARVVEPSKSTTVIKKYVLGLLRHFLTSPTMSNIHRPPMSYPQVYSRESSSDIKSR